MAFKGKILALDCATSTGWAIGLATADAPRFGSIVLKGHAVEERYVMLAEFVTAAIRKEKPSAIVYERPNSHIFHGATDRSIVEFLCGLVAIVGEHAWKCGVQTILHVDTSQTRNHFIGRNPKRAIAKKATIDRCHELGWRVENDDEADACAIWSYARCKVAPEMALKLSPLFNSKLRTRVQ